MIFSNLNGGRLLILINLFHILFSQAVKKACLPSPLQVFCELHQLYFSRMYGNEPSQPHCHSQRQFFPGIQGGQKDLAVSATEECLFVLKIVFALVWEIVCSYASFGVCLSLCSCPGLLVWSWQLILAVSRRTYCNNWYANRSLTQIRHIFHFHSSAVTGYTVTLSH